MAAQKAAAATFRAPLRLKEPPPPEPRLYLRLSRAASSGDAGSLRTATPTAPEERADAVTLRAFLRCVISALAAGFDKLGELTDRFATAAAGMAAGSARRGAGILDDGHDGDPIPRRGRLPAPRNTAALSPLPPSQQRPRVILLRVSALFEDLVAVHTAYLAWKADTIGVFEAQEAHAEAPGTVVPAAAVSPRTRDMLSAVLRRNDDPAISRVRGALSQLGAWSDGSLAGDLTPEFPPSAPLAALRTGVAEWLAIRKEALAYDHERFLPWVTAHFDRRSSAATLTQLLFGGTLTVREGASVVRWVLRSQVDAMAAHKFKATLAAGIGFERAQELLRYGLAEGALPDADATDADRPAATRAAASAALATGGFVGGSGGGGDRGAGGRGAGSSGSAFSELDMRAAPPLLQARARRAAAAGGGAGAGAGAGTSSVFASAQTVVLATMGDKEGGDAGSPGAQAPFTPRDTEDARVGPDHDLHSHAWSRSFSFIGSPRTDELRSPAGEATSERGVETGAAGGGTGGVGRGAVQGARSHRSRFVALPRVASHSRRLQERLRDEARTG
jgi:hypothetical protein